MLLDLRSLVRKHGVFGSNFGVSWQVCCETGGVSDVAVDCMFVGCAVEDTDWYTAVYHVPRSSSAVFGRKLFVFAGHAIENVRDVTSFPFV